MLGINEFLSSKPVMISFFFVGISIAVLWIATIYSVYQDIFNRTKNVVLQVASIAVAILFPFLGLLIYVLIRPAQTLEERLLQLLDEKIMRSEVGGVTLCPSCRKALDDDYLFCPNCQHKVKDTCHKCHKVISRKFRICPYCGQDIKASQMDPVAASAEETN